eukprot:5889015-Pleurochrysis_carterae.AAC.3
MGAQLLNLRHGTILVSLPTRMAVDITWTRIVDASLLTTRLGGSTFGRGLRAVAHAFTGVFRAVSTLCVSPGAEALLEFNVHASCTEDLSPIPRAPSVHSRRVIARGPSASARALLAERARRLASAHARGTSRKDVTCVVYSGCT